MVCISQTVSAVCLCKAVHSIHCSIVCLELQDGGSLDLILNLGRIPVNMIGKITIAVSPLYYVSNIL